MQACFFGDRLGIQKALKDDFVFGSFFVFIIRVITRVFETSVNEEIREFPYNLALSAHNACLLEQ